MLYFALGLIVGCAMGVFVSALCIIAKLDEVDYGYDDYQRRD